MRLGQWVRFGLFLAAVLTVLFSQPTGGHAAPYAAMVVDARSGEVLHSRNADTRLHPASLTKMMTLYIAFEAVERGEITLDTVVTISGNAAAEPPSKLGLKRGQKIKLRYLIRAAAIKSANDAATAIGEAISGSEAAFAARMNRTALAMGMTNTTFKNAHGLTQNGHMSTARDMTRLGRHVFYDYPEYYNLFSRITTHAGVREVANTNRRFLGAYKGADGIKTGYTRAAGFNLVASAERGSKRIIATVFGGRSTATRNQRVAELLDMGFSRAKTRVAIRKPARPPYMGNSGLMIADGASGGQRGAAGKIVRVSGLVTRSLRPVPRPGADTAPDEGVLVAMRTGIDDAVAAVAAEEAAAGAPVADPAAIAAAVAEVAGIIAPAAQAAPVPAIQPQPRPGGLRLTALRQPQASIDETGAATGEVVTRLSTSGGRHWAINIGRYGSRYQAERELLKTALVEIGTLDDALRKVVQRPSGFDANFVGLTEDSAERACRRLAARNIACTPIAPSS